MGIDSNLNLARLKAWEGWGKLRRLLLCTFYPEYVAGALSARSGECTRCGRCCRLLFKCPFLRNGNQCRIYGKRIKNCSRFPIDSRDTAHIGCNYAFPVEAKADEGMKIPVTRYAYREILILSGGAILGLAGSAVMFSYLPPAIASAAAAFFLLSMGFAFYFFRDPERSIPDEVNVILAPADGKVVSIEEVEEPEFIGGKALRIGIFLSIFNVHINRVPCSGVVKFIKYREGRFMNALSPKSSIHNESNMVGIAGTGSSPSKVVVKQIAGAIAKRIVCELKIDDHVENGQKFGMIKFGSRTEVYVPVEEGFEAAVTLKGRVKAGETILMRRKAS